jgi:beta-lactamase regulating signal transducer with metallopeptidase domain
MIDWLADTFLATSMLMALVLVVRAPVRRQFGAAAAYGLWLIPALRMVMPPLISTVERTVPASAQLAPSFPQTARPSVVPAVEPSLLEQLGGWEMLAVWLWLAGTVAMLSCGLLLYRSQRREVLRGSVEIARLGSIRVMRSVAVRGPMAFGIFDRVIALPIDFDDRYEPRERRLALDHELAHHRSGDLLVSHFAFILLCLQWFNPLAWLSHSAFRFDQEAVCDARVLDKASSDDRVAYARAITKAASGRALLFAGALDRPGTLHTRLRSILTCPSVGRRIAGKALVTVTAAAVLPLTASRATHYVDVPQASATSGASPVRSTGNAGPAPAPAELASAAPAGVAPRVGAADELPYPDLGGVTLGRNDVAFMEDDTVLISGKRKRLEQLSGAERTRLRATILRSQQDLVRDRAELPRRLAEARREADRARNGELRREHMQEIEDLRRDLAEVNSRAAELRAEGEDPEKRKAEILRDLRDAQATDIADEERDAIAEADAAKAEAELRREEQQMVRMRTKLDELDRRDRQ